jgi:hypothetical protein
MATIPPQEHILLDLTCSYCHKMNLIAVVPAPGASSYVERAIECAPLQENLGGVNSWDGRGWAVSQVILY